MTEKDAVKASTNQINPKQVVQEALDLANGGNIKLAIEKLKSWLNNNNEVNDVEKLCRYYLGVMYNKIGSVEQAIETWNEGITNKAPYNHPVFKSTIAVLSIFSKDITICTLIAEFCVPNNTDYDFHIAIASRRAKQAKDGPTVTYSLGQVCYGPNKLTEDETKQWIEQRVTDATQHYHAALALNADNPNLHAKFAGFLEWNKEYKKALKIWEILSEEYTISVICWVGMARCLYHLKEYKECKNILENVAIKIDPKEAEIYTILQSVAEKLNLSDEYVQALSNKNKFYSTIPEWLNMTFNHDVWIKFSKLFNIKCAESDAENGTDENVVDEAKKEKENYIETLLNVDFSLVSTKLLISYVNGHYNHSVESKIFNCLIDRIQNHNQDLLPYIREMLGAGSVCVIKGAANTLAELKDNESVAMLCKLLPQDTQAFWCMHIADALGKLQNYQAINVLAKTVSYGFNNESSDNNGGDIMMIDHAGNQQRCAIALGMFTDMKRNQIAVKTLRMGCNVTIKQELRVCCLVSLFRIYATNIIDNNDESDNEYKKEFEQLFQQILSYLNSMKGNGVSFVVKYVIHTPLKTVQENAMHNGVEYVVKKCEKLFGVIEQEETAEKIRKIKKSNEQQENKTNEQNDDNPASD